MIVSEGSLLSTVQYRTVVSRNTSIGQKRQRQCSRRRRRAIDLDFLPDDIIKIIAHRPKAPHVIVAAFLWVSASRYGDLKWVRITTKQFIDGPEPLWLVLFNYRGSKGDPSGARGDQKAIFIPEVWLETLRLQLPKELSKTTEARASDVKVKVESEYPLSLRTPPNTVARFPVSKEATGARNPRILCTRAIVEEYIPHVPASLPTICRKAKP